MFRTLNPSRDEALDYMVKTEKIVLITVTLTIKFNFKSWQ